MSLIPYPPIYSMPSNRLPLSTEIITKLILSLFSSYCHTILTSFFVFISNYNFKFRTESEISSPRPLEVNTTKMWVSFSNLSGVFVFPIFSHVCHLHNAEYEGAIRHGMPPRHLHFKVYLKGSLLTS